MRLTVRSATLLLMQCSLCLPALAADERGRLLYENHCQVCHTSVVHVREARKVKTAAELRAFIARWSGELKLDWGTEEREAVYRYLNSRYYKLLPEKKP